MDIKTISVLGAGIMGRGIAQVAAMGGYTTYLYDVFPEAIDQAYGIIESNLQKGVKIGKVDEKTAKETMERIIKTQDRSLAASKADFVIEVAPEDIEIKLEIFRALDKECPKHAILATNTSAKSITEIARATSRPDQVIGMHFFNPVHIMKLVEIIRGLETSDETLAATIEVSKRMGKETIEVNEFPGFVTSRISAMVGNECFYMMQEGVASPEDIDKAIVLGLNFPMGPLALGDMVGLDSRLKVMEYLHETLGEKYRPCPLMVKYVKAGRLGRKTGRGVFEYNK